MANGRRLFQRYHMSFLKEVLVPFYPINTAWVVFPSDLKMDPLNLYPTSTRVPEGALSYSLIYPTPCIPSSLTWIPQSRLAFGHHHKVGWPAGHWPLAITILQCAALLAAGGQDRPSGPIDYGSLLYNKAFSHSPSCSTESQSKDPLIRLLSTFGRARVGLWGYYQDRAVVFVVVEITPSVHSQRHNMVFLVISPVQCDSINNILQTIW